MLRWMRAHVGELETSVMPHGRSAQQQRRHAKRAAATPDTTALPGQRKWAMFSAENRGSDRLKWKNLSTA
jgi:hypothetical protein